MSFLPKESEQHKVSQGFKVVSLNFPGSAFGETNHYPSINCTHSDKFYRCDAINKNEVQRFFQL